MKLPKGSRYDASIPLARKLTQGGLSATALIDPDVIDIVEDLWLRL